LIEIVFTKKKGAKLNKCQSSKICSNFSAIEISAKSTIGSLVWAMFKTTEPGNIRKAGRKSSRIQKKADKMGPNEIKLALEIMARIGSRPCAIPFLEPVDDEKYYQKIHEPTDISMIVHRLRIGDYDSSAEWHRDMGLIRKNTISYYGQGNPQCALANCLYRAFEKEFESFKPPSVASVMKTYAQLVIRLQFLGDRVTSCLAPMSIVVRTLGFAVPETPESDAVSSESDERGNLEALFLKSVVELPSVSDAGELVRLIRDLEPDLSIDGPNPEICIDNLRVSTLKRLMGYVERRFLELEISVK
jgi:hypothetical protein